MNNVFMRSDELREHLVALGVSQADFARLLDVTPRGVALWLGGDRSIPGPVEAYVRLLRSLPMNLRQVELGRLRERKSVMRNGMYGITFQSANDYGAGLLTFEDGLVYGVDSAGVKYDGDYEIDPGTHLAKLNLKVTFPPNTQSVFGVSNPYEWSIDVTTTLDPSKDQGNCLVQSSVGIALNAQYRFMRSLPVAA